MKIKGLGLTLLLLVLSVNLFAQSYEFEFEHDDVEYKYIISKAYDANFEGYWLNIKPEIEDAQQVDFAVIVKGTQETEENPHRHISGNPLFDSYMNKGGTGKVVYDMLIHIVNPEEVLATYELKDDLLREIYYNPSLQPMEDRDKIEKLYGTQFDLLNNIVEKFISASDYVKTKSKNS